MGFFDWLKKKEPTGNAAAGQTPDHRWDAIPSGMRVEVTTEDGQILFGARLMNPQKEGTAKLYQYSEMTVPENSEPMRVQIRGYNDQVHAAVYMQGVITLQPKHIWNVEELVLLRVGRDRAFYRLDVNLDATVTCFHGLNAGERPCKLVNVSVGGAGIASSVHYHEHDKLLLKVQMLEDRDLSVMMCQILRVTKKENGMFEYGCRFVGMSEAVEAKISHHIFTTQIKKRR